MESYIANQIENGDISWFPTHKALILIGYGVSEDTNNVTESLKKMDEDQMELMQEASELSKNFFTLEDLIKKYDLKKVNGMSKMSRFSSTIDKSRDETGSSKRKGKSLSFGSSKNGKKKDGKKIEYDEQDDESDNEEDDDF